jgi:hypothetical protein
MRARIVSVAVGLWLCAASLVAQQGTASIGGKVADQGGGVLPGVTIVITNEDTGINREVTTAVDGSYFASQVNPGRYRVSAKLPGFKTLERRGLSLEVGRTSTLDLTLEVGGLEETVTVTSSAPLVDTTSAQLGGHISASEISELPQTTRSYMALVGNVPGAQFVQGGGFLNDTMLANGQPAAANAINVDGASNTDDQRGSNVGGQARTANETLQEVQVMTNQFDAEFGRTSGAVVNAVTKSGTNQLSGSVFQYFTGKNVTAKSYFAKVNDLPKPDIGKTEWGGTFGGPIVQNKLFYFSSLERVTQKRPLVGEFPTRPELNYSTVDAVGAWNTFLRFDHQLTRNHTWAFRWQREVAPQLQVDGPLPEVLKTDGDEVDQDQSFVGTLTSVIGNTLVNTFRVSRIHEVFTQAQPLSRMQQPEYEACNACPLQMMNDITLLPPRLNYASFGIQAGSNMNLWENASHAFENTISWFVPGRFGKHDIKFGVKFSHVYMDNPNYANGNGTFTFNHDLVYDAANPRTYPERFSIVVPGPRFFEMTSRVYEGFVQDKWQFKNVTLSVGLRYDLEDTPIDESNNPLFSDPSAYPMDKNNIAPRFGFVWNPDGQGKSVFRGGWGMFYDKTILGTIDDILLNQKYSGSFTAQFPLNAADPGPANGQFPTDPTLRGGVFTELTPEVRAYINSVYPPGSLARNTGTVSWDDPDRKVPYFYQTSVGYSREILPSTSFSADYIRMRGHEQFLNPNLNIGTRLTTARSGRVVFTDPFGVLTPSLQSGETAYAGPVSLRTTKYGYSLYDSLSLSMEKRFSRGWSARGAYSLGYSRGVTSGQNDSPDLQVGDDLNLDEWFARANIDRRHTLTMSGRMDIPFTHGVNLSGTVRLMSGTPFTIHNTNIDADQNSIFFDPLPAGTYSTTAEIGMRDVEFDGKRNGAQGPGYMQLDLRVGYRFRLGGKRTADVFGDFFNATNHVNFLNPSGDLRNPADFLRYTALAAPGTGRQFQLGLRFGF